MLDSRIRVVCCAHGPPNACRRMGSQRARHPPRVDSHRGHSRPCRRHSDTSPSAARACQPETPRWPPVQHARPPRDRRPLDASRRRVQHSDVTHAHDLAKWLRHGATRDSQRTIRRREGLPFFPDGPPCHPSRKDTERRDIVQREQNVARSGMEATSGVALPAGHSCASRSRTHGGFCARQSALFSPLHVQDPMSTLESREILGETVKALIGFQGRGLDEVVPPDFCHQERPRSPAVQGGEERAWPRRGHSGAIRGRGSPGLQAGEDVHDLFLKALIVQWP
jgi:hypothetical protein